MLLSGLVAAATLSSSSSPRASRNRGETLASSGGLARDVVGAPRSRAVCPPDGPARAHSRREAAGATSLRLRNRRRDLLLPTDDYFELRDGSDILTATSSTAV